MKKIKLPLEMANGVMVRSLDELKENWDLEKVVEHFVTGKLTTWLNDRYYTDLAEKVENLPKDGDGRKLQQALCRVFEVPCEELELDVDEIAERKRRQDLLRQYTSDDEILKNVDKVAFNQEDLADLLDDEIAEIYLFNNKFTIPLSIEGKKYIGIGDNAVAEIRSKKSVNFAELGIEFTNVKFDAKYAEVADDSPDKIYKEATALENDKVYDKAFEEFKKLVDIGDPRGFVKVALYYIQGYGVEENYDEAQKFYDKAVKIDKRLKLDLGRSFSRIDLERGPKRAYEVAKEIGLGTPDFVVALKKIGINKSAVAILTYSEYVAVKKHILVERIYEKLRTYY